MAWNVQDPSQLLTTGYDCRTLLWDVPEGEVRGELPLQAGPGRDVRWCPRQPNLIATATEAWDGAGSTSQSGQVRFEALPALECKFERPEASPDRDKDMRWCPSNPI